MASKFNPSVDLQNNMGIAVDRFLEDLDDILYKEGYEVTGSYSNDGVRVSTKYSGSNAAIMPTIDLRFEIYEDSQWIVIPTVTFPSLSSDDTYADSTEYAIKEWLSVGKAITQINKYAFDAEGYIADWLDGEYV